MFAARIVRAVGLVALALEGMGCPGPGAAPGFRRPEARLSEPGCGESPDRSALDEVRKKVAALRKAGGTPLVVFDLDDTLVDSATRTRAVLRDALRSPAAPAGADLAAERLDALCLSEYPVDLEGTLDRAELAPNVRRYLQEAWAKVGPGERHLDRAVPLRGAATWVAELRAKGATIVYLTNRNGRRVRDGTLRALDARGFPVVRDGAVLVMQPGDGADSLSWKQEEAEKLASRGTVVATFENEPANVGMYRQLFPEAIPVLVVSRHRERHPPLPAGTRCIVDYREAR